MGQSDARREWHEGWLLVLSAAAGFSFFSVMTTGIGAFMDPLSAEFGWSRTVLSLGLPIGGLISVLCSPFIGVVVDRFGSRKLALPGIIMMALCTASFSLANGSVTQWVALWVGYALASLMVTMNVWTAAVAGAFTAARGLALGVTLAGTAVAQAVSPVAATLLIDNFGWRTAFVVLALAWGGLAFLLCALFFRDHSREVSVVSDNGTINRQVQGVSIAQAWRNSTLWRIAISTFVLMVLTIGLLVHQIPILTELGVSREKAALLAGLGGVAGIFGKLVTGVLIDRYRANWVGGITLGGTAFAFALLLDGIRTPALVVVAMMINGYAAGTKLQICSYLTSRYAGLRHFGAIFGAMSSLVALGSALGPLLAGMVYDLTGEYSAFIAVGAIGCLLCGALIVSLPGYPDWTGTAPARESDAPKTALSPAPAIPMTTSDANSLR